MYNIILFILVFFVVSFLMLLGAAMNEAYNAVKRNDKLNKTDNFTYDKELFK